MSKTDGPAPQPAPHKALSGEDARQAGIAADAYAATLGRMFAILCASPRHRKASLEDVSALVIPALSLGQYAAIGVKPDDGRPPQMAALCLWAFVSDAVDKQLTDDRSAVLRLAPADWTSGTIPWIIEAAGEQRAVEVLINSVASQHFGGRPAKLRGVKADGTVAIARLQPAKAPAP